MAWLQILPGILLQDQVLQNHLLRNWLLPRKTAHCRRLPPLRDKA
jgi:hypothetical protein